VVEKVQQLINAHNRLLDHRIPTDINQ